MRNLLCAAFWIVLVLAVCRRAACLIPVCPTALCFCALNLSTFGPFLAVFCLVVCVRTRKGERPRILATVRRHPRSSVTIACASTGSGQSGPVRRHSGSVRHLVWDACLPYVLQSRNGAPRSTTEPSFQPSYLHRHSLILRSRLVLAFHDVLPAT